MTTDIKELYKQRKNLCNDLKSKAQETLDRLNKIKSEIEQKYIEKAKGDAEAYFNCAHSGEWMQAQQDLANANLELSLLRCPNDNQHQRPEGRYYRCDTCGYVFDDTSPAHF